MIQTLKYRARYYWRKVCHFLGFCPACGERVNVILNGVAVCPNCRAR